MTFTFSLVLAPLMLALVPDTTRKDNNTGWVGKTVFARTIGVQIHRIDEQDQLVPLVQLMGLDYIVLAEKNDRIQLKTREGIVGWLEKKNVVLLDEAMPYFTRRIEENAGDHDAYNRRGWALKLRGEHDAAIKDFTEAIRLREDPAHYNNRALVWAGKKDYAKAVDDYTHAIQLNPQYALPYSNRGAMWNAQKQYDKGIDDFTTALQLNPRFVNAYRYRGHAWHAKKLYEKAIDDYSQALAIDPKSVSTYNDRGASWLARKNLEKAFADFDEALRIDPRSSAAHYQRGRAWSAQKEHDKAISDFSEALRLNPKYVAALAERGNSWCRKNSYAKAADDFQLALHCNPKDAKACMATAMFLASCPQAKFRDGKRALILAQQALDEDKEQPAILEALAAAHAELGQFTDAVRFQEQALADPQLKNDMAALRRLALYRKQMPYRQEN